MTDARADILEGIRRGLGRGPLDGPDRDAMLARLRRRGRHVVPSRVDLDPEGLVALFVAKAEAVGATVEALADEADIPRAVASLLARENLPARIVQAPALEGWNYSWEAAPAVEARSGAAARTDEASLSPALAGVAETGTLVLASGPDTPTTLNFVPPQHIVALRRRDVVAAYEDAWDRVRDGAADGLPRAVNFVTGPSRTGDIEQKIQIGVHGPVRLHILLAGD